MTNFMKLLTTKRSNLFKKLQNTIKSGRKIVLFGAGGVGVFTYRTLMEKNIPIAAFCDNNPLKQGKKISGLFVYSYDELKVVIPEALILITIGPAKAIEQVVLQLKNDNIFSDFIISTFYLFDENYVHYILSKYSSDMEQVYDMLKDERSKEVFLKKINYIISGDVEFLKNISDPNQYFCLDIVKVEHDDIFVDCGGYDGNNSLDFIKYSGNKNAKVYIFEPDPENLILIHKNLVQFPNVEIIPSATWSHDCKLPISITSGQGTAISENGESFIYAKSIDSFLNGRKANFIKMDVEGAEYESLLGAEKTIKNFKPKLAICIYHSFLDHWRLQKVIYSFCKDYQFFIRHHYDSAIETVCYAIPYSK